MSHGSSRIALVTVLFNCEKHLPLFFECLGGQTDKDFVVVVIDNASRDASLENARQLAQMHSVSCEYIPNAENLGIAVGNNQGIEHARKLGLQHVVLINNDIGCEGDLIAKIRERAIVAEHRAWTCLAWYGDTYRRWYTNGGRWIGSAQGGGSKVTTLGWMDAQNQRMVKLHVGKVLWSVGSGYPDVNAPHGNLKGMSASQTLKWQGLTWTPEISWVRLSKGMDVEASKRNNVRLGVTVLMPL